MNSILRSTVLSLLYPERGTPPDSPADNLTIQINQIDYTVLASTIDVLLKDAKAGIQVARIILTLEPTTGDTKLTPRVEVAAHALLWLRDSSPHDVIRIEIILDSDAISVPGQDTSHASSRPTAQRASLIPTHAPPPPPPPPPPPRRPLSSFSSPTAATETTAAAAPQNLAATYRAYIAAINARAMATTLPRFCHATVTHNTVPRTLAEYQSLMEDAQAAIPDITFVISDLITDEDRQMVAARLEFTGTPVKAFAGVVPPAEEELEGRRREVRFSEVVFYWFQEGKIREVVSLVDLETYRKQVKG